MKDNVKNPQLKNETVTISGVKLTLSSPDATDPKWIGQEEILKQVLACWLVVAKEDMPLSPRILGMPGIGKTTLGMAAARALCLGPGLHLGLYRQRLSRKKIAPRLKLLHENPALIDARKPLDRPSGVVP